jgi:lipid-binding SYLF domain-containing protein
MKRSLALCVGLTLVASSAFAELKKDEVKKLNEASAVLSELREAPDKGIPEDLWNKAECVVVFPSVKKGAFLVGGEFGSGVMSCRHDHAWSAPVFMHLAKGSFGAQLGAEETDLVLLVMNRRGADKMLEDKTTLGADASIAAGPVGRAGSAATDAQLNAEILSYSRSRGLFAGIDLSGGVVRPDNDADARAYGASLSARDIVAGNEKVVQPPPVKAFVASLGNEVRATTGKR